MLKPVVRAGFGIVGGLSIVLETHHVDNDAEVGYSRSDSSPMLPL
jgi:hypothetical protein